MFEGKQTFVYLVSLKEMIPMLKRVSLAAVFLLALAVPVGTRAATYEQTFGVVALSNVGSIGIVDADTQTVTAPLLTGEFGSFGGGLFDVVITPDGNTTLISNFGDKMIYFIDTSDPSAPVVSGSVLAGTFVDDDGDGKWDAPEDLDDLDWDGEWDEGEDFDDVDGDGVWDAGEEVLDSMFAEDMVITPDGCFVLVSDGGFSPSIAVIDIANQTLVELYNDFDPEDPEDVYTMHQAVAITPDGQTVLTVDYFSGLLNVFTLDDAGHLTFVESLEAGVGIDGDDNTILYPVNVTISPDGQTAILAVTAATADMAFPVFNITGPGQVTASDPVTPDLSLRGCQSVVFNNEGTKAYLHCVQPMPEAANASFEPITPTPEPSPATTQATLAVAAEPVQPDNLIIVLDVTAPGEVSDAATPISVGVLGTSQLFGVDTMAFDNPGEYLYVSNPTLSGAAAYVQVIDAATNTVTKTIDLDNTFTGEPDEPVDGTVTLPTGIAFWNPPDTTPPTGEITINEADTYTTQTAVTLQLGAIDDEIHQGGDLSMKLASSDTEDLEMMLANTADLAGASWEAFAAEKAWTLTDTDGEKTVYVKYRDEAGNESEVLSDTIIYDSTPPEGTIIINDGDEYTNALAVNLTIAATDETSGVGEMMLSEDETFADGSWVAYAVSKEFTLSTPDGTKTVYVKFIDNAGNESEVASDSIILDTQTEVDVTTVAGEDFAEGDGGLQKTEKQRPTLTGDGEPGALVTITIIVNGVPVVGTTIVDEDGHWSWTPDADIPYGLYEVTIDILDLAGNTERQEFNLQVVNPATELNASGPSQLMLLFYCLLVPWVLANGRTLVHRFRHAAVRI
jgi:hypothetical protein